MCVCVCVYYFVDLIIIDIVRFTPPKNLVGATAYGSDSDYGGINVTFLIEKVMVQVNDIIFLLLKN